MPALSTQRCERHIRKQRVFIGPKTHSALATLIGWLVRHRPLAAVAGLHGNTLNRMTWLASDKEKATMMDHFIVWQLRGVRYLCTGERGGFVQMIERLPLQGGAA